MNSKYWHVIEDKKKHTTTYALDETSADTIEKLRQAVAELKFMRGNERVYIDDWGTLVVEDD